MLAPHIHAATFGDRVVLLDVEADRYRLISGDAARVVVAELERHQISDTIMTAALFKAGIFVAEPTGPAHARRPMPAIPAGRLPDRVPSKRAILPTLRALLSARFRLRRWGLARTLAQASARAPATRSVDVDIAAITVAAVFARARVLIPLSRACLPDSLALFELLKRAGSRATLVIGVRLDPFLAHCWVQTDQFILNDDPDSVLAYTPILAL